MNSPLENVPLNTKKVYVRGITQNGCKIYMPVDHYDDSHIDSKKAQLQMYLNGQFLPRSPEAA